MKHRLFHATLLSLALVPLAAAQTPERPMPPPNPLAGSDPWVGSYTDGNLRLTLERAGAGYGGTVALGGQAYPLTAQGGPDRLGGSFQVQGHAFQLTLTREGDGVALVTDGTTYRLRREGPRNPLAQPGGGATPGGASPPAAGGAPTAPAAPPASSIPDDWQRWRHPLGYVLRYPPGWQLQETELGLTLVPPDMARDPSGQAMELVVLGAVPTEGVTRPDDPRALAYLEQVVGGSLPFLRRAGEVKKRGPQGKEVVEMPFAGTNPMGKRFQGLAMLAIVGDQGVIGLLVAEPERFAQREGTVRSIFSSAGLGEAQRDARLVGVWRCEKHTFSGTFSSTSMRTIALRPDGSCSDSARTFAGMDHKDSGGNLTGRSDVDTGEGGARPGSWAAAGDRLILRWGDGGVEEYRFELSGPNLLLKPAQGEPRLYERVQ